MKKTLSVHKQIEENRTDFYEQATMGVCALKFKLFSLLLSYSQDSYQVGIYIESFECCLNGLALPMSLENVLPFRLIMKLKSYVNSVHCLLLLLLPAFLLLFFDGKPISL